VACASFNILEAHDLFGDDISRAMVSRMCGGGGQVAGELSGAEAAVLTTSHVT